MELSDWSKGCVYLGSYVDIVLMCSECDVLQSHRVPVATIVSISPWNKRARPTLLCSVSGEGTTHYVMKPAAALDTRITQETTVYNIIEECPLHEGFLPLQYYMIIHENMIVCTVCDYTFAVEMHMVEHSRRNWLSDAPEGGWGRR